MPTKNKKTDNNPQTPGSPPRRKSNRTRGQDPAPLEPDLSSIGKPQGAAKGQRPRGNLEGPTTRKPAPTPNSNVKAKNGKGQRPDPQKQTSPGTADPAHGDTPASLAQVVRGEGVLPPRREPRPVTRRDLEDFAEERAIEQALKISRQEARNRAGRTPRPADHDGEAESESADEDAQSVDESKARDPIEVIQALADQRGIPAEAARAIKAVVAGLRAEDREKGSRAQFGAVLRPEKPQGPPGMIRGRQDRSSANQHAYDHSFGVAGLMPVPSSDAVPDLQVTPPAGPRGGTRGADGRG